MNSKTLEKKTFCRVCEPACGLIATVADDQLVRLRADQDHPVSKGFVGNKGIYGLDIHNDPDRLRVPLKRTASGDFEEVSCDQALRNFIERLIPRYLFKVARYRALQWHPKSIGVIVDIDEATGQATAVKRVSELIDLANNHPKNNNGGPEKQEETTE